jgi:hypothetical protein
MVNPKTLLQWFPLLLLPVIAIAGGCSQTAPASGDPVEEIVEEAALDDQIAAVREGRLKAIVLEQ